MQRIYILIFLLCCKNIQGQDYKKILIPYPQACSFNEARFPVSVGFTVTVSGHPDKRIYGAATRMLTRLKGRTGLFITRQEVLSADGAPASGLHIRVARAANNVLGEDESYHLVITADGVTLNAETDLGAIRGLETVLQLLQAGNGYYYLPGCVIDDAPRFPWRGLLIDVGRHFMPVGVIKRNIDGMAAVKMNVLHLHLTEDQGFRIECKTFPKLHELGSVGEYYSQDQIRDLLHYAGERGIRIVPEFDMPGHTSSWFAGYPELASAPGPYHVEHRLGVMDPVMDPARESTYTFIDAFLGEMSKLFPDEYIHIGGDENNGKQWNGNAAIQLFMQEHSIHSNNELQAYFNRRLLAITEKYGKKMIGWDEIMQPGIPTSAIIQSWRGMEGLATAAKAGYAVILSSGYYIDLNFPASDHYLTDPLPDSLHLTMPQRKLILGGEATMWSEMVTWETIDSRIWPRTAAIAERLWSDASVNDVPNMYAKLERISPQLEELGLTHEKNVDMFLRRLAGNENVPALRAFTDVLEPIKDYGLIDYAGYTTGSPFTKIVDAVRPDAKVARDFNTLARNFAANTKDAVTEKRIRQWLLQWKDNHLALQSAFRRYPAIQEVETLSRDLSVISVSGLEALDYIRMKKQPPLLWRNRVENNLKQASRPRGMTEIMVVTGIRKLVETANGYF
ncbi:MAG: family 20 glycosylhydrolase [Bacteroidota bacterium]|nr:family 20 glycosylhydrolase [Bacteroidota bacterium]